ncbi:hypothetical protein [Megasphaera elsdenii]|jgi:hypothetical protein|uniref:hypothetical protein n=1 Tax=Megasphaera elsdenii TaxID=907 RepID=UPI002432E553|nr:hypothetical protein [Megasphaera elsdenii]
MSSRYSLIDIMALFFFLCISLSNSLTTSQLTVPRFGSMGLIFAAGVFLLCTYFKLGKVKATGIVFAAILFFISIISYIYTGTLAAFRVFLFVLIARELSYRKMILYNNSMLFIAFMGIVLSSFVGITDRYWTGTSDKLFYLQTVYTFGFKNPNTPPIIIFALMTGYNLLRDSSLKVKEIFVEFLITGIAFYLFQSRTAAWVTAAYLLALLFVRKRMIFSSLKWLLWPLQYLFLVGTVLTLFIAFNFYALDSSWQDLNFLMSGRLFLWQNFIQTYGIHWFGNNMTLNTDPLDNGFLYLIIWYGVSMLVVYSFMFIYISRYAYKHKKGILFLTIIACELYCFGESTPLSFNYSPVLLYFASLIMNEKTVQQDEPVLLNQSTN